MALKISEGCCWRMFLKDLMGALKTNAPQLKLQTSIVSTSHRTYWLTVSPSRDSATVQFGIKNMGYGKCTFSLNHLENLFRALECIWKL